MFERIHLLNNLIICTRSSNYMSPTEQANPIALPISLSFLLEHPHSYLLKLQPQSSVQLLFIFCNISL